MRMDNAPRCIVWSQRRVNENKGRHKVMSHEPAQRPSADEVAKRIIVLKYVVGYAVTTPPRRVIMQYFRAWNAADRAKFMEENQKMRDEYWEPLRALGLWDVLSPRESAFASHSSLTMTDQEQIDASWRIEAVQALMWALGFLPDLPPYDTLADPGLLKSIPSRDVGEVTKFIESAQLLPSEQIDAARDLAELWHWRSRTRQLIEEGQTLDASPQMKAAGLNTFDDIVRFTANRCKERKVIDVIDDDFALFGKAYRDLTPDEWSAVCSITVERHFALNWLCGYAPGNRWDETPTDT